MTAPDSHRDMVELTAAVRAIAHGDVNGPGGLEALAMALTDGPPGQDNLAQAIRDAGESIERGLLALADVLAERKDAP